MKTIETELQYQEALNKIEVLMTKVGSNHSYDNPEFVMMDRLSDLVADYEDQKYHIKCLPLSMSLR